ncbi:MAG: ABC transporter permease [Nitrospiraceae bacterium]|nr:ABC transporter permease [Nitrospiraceae bacterium]
MFRGLTSIVYKETIHVIRDPKTLFLMLLVPGIQLTVFGYAIDLDVKNIPTAVYNLDGRPESRDLLDAFTNAGYFNIVKTATSDKDLYAAIVRGDAQVGIKIPPDYTDLLVLGRNAPVQVLIDGSNSTVAMQALNVTNAIGLRESLNIVNKTLDRRGGLPIQVEPRVLFNPDMKTVNFMVPGLVGLVMQLVTMLLTALAVVREKENGTLEQLMVTPVSRFGLMIGKIVPFFVIGALETVMVLSIMRFLFDVPIAGSVALLAAFSLAFLFTTLGLGLLISTYAANQIQAIQLAFLVVLPSVLLSGFVFPQESMPYPIWAIGQLIPLTYFIRILRGIIIRGAGFYDLWQNGAVLGGMGLAVLSLSALRFRKTLS